MHWSGAPVSGAAGYPGARARRRPLNAALDVADPQFAAERVASSKEVRGNMPIQISIADTTTKYFNTQAVAITQASVLKFADDLCKEAGRLEAAARTTGGDPEITSSMVRDADLLLRRGYRQPRLRGWMVTARVAAPVAGFVTGLLADLQKLKDPEWLIAFIVLLAITITVTVLVASKE
jgi:hypothetical protein